MITATTIGYRALNGETASATFEVSATSEAVAFDQAVRQLQLQLISRVLDIRPHAESYTRS